MIPYWLLWSFFFLGVILSQRQVQPQAAGPVPANAPRVSIGMSVGLIVLTLMIGFRYQVGGDWLNYEEIFKRSAFRTFDQTILQSDPGYALLNWATQQLGYDVWLINLVCGLLTVWGTFALARREPQPWLSLLIAVPYLIIVVGMGYTRQAAALGLVMVGLASLLNTGSIARMVLWTAVGTLFHKSAVVCLPLVAFTGDRRKIIDLALLTSSALGLYTLFLQDSVDRLFRNYVEARYNSSGAAIRISMSLLPAIVFMAFQRRLGLNENDAKLWRNFSLVAIGATVALFLSPSSTAVDRISLYLLPLQFIILARIPGTLLSRNFGKLLIGAYTAAVLYIWLNFAANAHGWLPYRSWLDA
ncbi:EpsG family protein [Sphingomonas glaciei]|uniref:EpsG family protein n=1 Tax=Sphingomonas glaciei TaxID=2938948 RepID=A0ABY5MWQ7_9SPHN|nr:EpsG family protein [Sphingomonas glaciei]UUR08414.1 EpsG family protein [Sphingomonas glaciei]